jgi:hypothetical protein
VQIQIQMSAYPFPKEVHHFGFSDPKKFSQNLSQQAINITVLYKTGQELQPKPILCELGYGFQVQIQIQISAYPFPKEVHHFGFSDSHTLM